MREVLDPELLLELVESGQLDPEAYRVLGKLLTCRTEWLGARRGECAAPGCDYTELVCRACCHRHCMLCGTVEELRWIGARSTWQLPVSHLHAVLTLPAKLRDLAWGNKGPVYRLLLDAAVGAIEDRLGEALGVPVGARPGAEGRARPAITAVLHTWSRRVTFHPHVHAIVAAGALTADGSRWITAPDGTCALPADERLREPFSGRMLDGLAKLRARNKLAFSGKVAHLADDATWAALLDSLRIAPACGLQPGPGASASTSASAIPGRRPYWHVYAKAPLGGRAVLAYLARYAVRIGLSWARLVQVDRARGEVVIATKGGQTERLSQRELVRRIMLHVLPRGLMRIRYRGLYQGRQRDGNALARQRLEEQGLALPCAIEPDDPLAVFMPGGPATTKAAVRAASQALEQALREAEAASGADPGSSSATGSAQLDAYTMAKTGVDLSRCPRCGKALVFTQVPPRRGSLSGAQRSAIARARAGLPPRGPPATPGGVQVATT